MKFPRKLGLFSLAALIGWAGYAIAQSVYPVVTTLTGTELIQIYTTAPTNQYVTANTLGAFGRSSSLLYVNTATASSTATTAEQTLLTYSIPAANLKVGNIVTIDASFTAAANSNNKTFKCYFGSEVITSGTLTTNNKNGSCQVKVDVIGAGGQIVYGNMLVDTTPITGYVASGTETIANAIVVKLTATQGTASAGDVVGNFLQVSKTGP